MSLFIYDLKHTSERWYLGLGWTSSLIPLVDWPSETIITYSDDSIRNYFSENSFQALQDGNWHVLFGEKEKWDENGWNYATAFSSLKKFSKKENYSLTPAAGISYEEEKIDYVRMKISVRRRLLHLEERLPQKDPFVRVESKPKKVNQVEFEMKEVCCNAPNFQKNEEEEKEYFDSPEESVFKLCNKSNAWLYLAYYQIQDSTFIRIGQPKLLHYGCNFIVSCFDTKCNALLVSHCSELLEQYLGEYVYIDSNLIVNVILPEPNSKVYIVTKQNDVIPSSPPELNLALSLGHFDSSDKHRNTVSYIPDLQFMPSWQWKVFKHTHFWEKQKDFVRKYQSLHNYDKIPEVLLRKQNELCTEEINAVAAKKLKCDFSTATFLDISFQDGYFEPCDMPSISLAYSGGGCRATIGSLGLTLGLMDINLYPSILYTSGLSGGSWFQLLWNFSDQPIEEFNSSLRQAFSESPFIVGPKRAEWVMSYLMREVSHKAENELSLSDLYGSLLLLQWLQPNKIRSSDLLEASLSFQKCDIDKPIPIYNAVHPNAPPSYDWVEFTSWEVRFLSPKLSASIPTWAFGRQFVRGNCVTVAPEVGLGCLMGLWGSAFSASFSEILRNVGYKSAALSALLNALPATHRPLDPPTYWNPTYEMKHVDLYQLAEIELVDAGVCMNGPLPPLLARKLDIILLFDARPTEFDHHDSKDVLKTLEKFCSLEGIKLPRIDYNNVGVNNLSVFMDMDDITIPTILYIPLIKNSAYSDEIDPSVDSWSDFGEFSYQPKNFDLLCGLMRHNVSDIKSRLKEVLRSVAEKKRHFRLHNANCSK